MALTRSVSSSMFAAVVFAGVAGTAVGQSVLVPPQFAAASGGGAQTTLTRELPRLAQYIYSSSLLTGIPHGSQIVGVRFRQGFGDTSAWPAADVSWTSYQIELGSSNNAPASGSTTFANNPSADNVVVRSGALTIEANSFPAAPNGTSVAPFGPVIVFTRPYIYQGGTDLVMTITHDGNSGGTNTGIDSVNTIDPAFGTTVYGVFSSTVPSATGGTTPVPVTAIVYRPPPAANAVVLPPQANLEPGTVSQFLLRNIAAGATQMILAPNQLGGIPPGSDFTSMSFRSIAAGPTPTTAGATADFSLQLSSTNATPASTSAMIASNLLADAVVVRPSADLGISAFSYAGTGAEPVSPFGAEVGFATPFTYKGGALAVVLRRGTSPAGLLGTEALNFSANGYGTNFVAKFNNPGDANTPTAATNTGMPVMRLEYAPATVIPNAFAAVPGTGSQSLPITNVAFTQCVVIAESQLRHIPVGSAIHAISYRLDENQASFPVGGNAVFSRYDITLATAATTPGTFSTTVANNLGADALLVRQGPMTIKSDSWSGTEPVGFPSPWAPSINFDKPFIYQGGGLAMVVRHSDHNRGFSFADAAVTADALRGVAYQHGTASGADATTAGGSPSFPIFRLHFTASDVAPVARRVAAGNSNINSPLRDDARVIQMLFSEAELADQSIRPGSLITAMGYRLPNRRSWPFTDALWTDYTITLSTSPRTPASASLIFANNEGADLLTVRSGRLVIPALALVGDPEVPVAFPHHVSYYFTFNKPFVYTGGTLCVTTRHTGNATGTTMEVDGVNSVGAGYGTRFVCITPNVGTPGTNIPSGSLFTCPITTFAFTRPSACSNADIAASDGSPGADGQVNNGDFQLFFVSFFGGCAVPGQVPCGPADIAQSDGTPGADGQVNNGDFQLFFAEFFLGC